MAEAWPYPDPEDFDAVTLKRIVAGESPILRVAHDEGGGGWQFLDGGGFDVEDAVLASLKAIVGIDPGLLELADLPAGWVAERDAPGGPWRRSAAASEEEDRERRLTSDVEEFGWHVIAVPEDDEGPAFAYSVGLSRSFGHPEVILFGLDPGAMHGIINLIAGRVKRGEKFSAGGPVGGILDGYGVRFLDVDPKHYAEFFGYARWFSKGDGFPALQCLWPDRHGRFPADPGFPESLRDRQPLLAGPGAGGGAA